MYGLNKHIDVGKSAEHKRNIISNSAIYSRAFGCTMPKYKVFNNTAAAIRVNTLFSG